MSGREECEQDGREWRRPTDRRWRVLSAGGGVQYIARFVARRVRRRK